jgi:exonuclease VII large subunit
MVNTDDHAARAVANLRNAKRRESRAKGNTSHTQEDLQTLSAKMDDVQAQLSHQEQLNTTLLTENTGLHCSTATLDHGSQALKRTITELEEGLKHEIHAHEKTTKKLKRMHDSSTRTREEKKALEKKVARIDVRLERACNKARSSTEKHHNTTTSVSMKKKGRMTSKFKALYRDLLDHGVSNENVDAVIHSVYKAANINVTDHVSARAVSRANVEGLIQAELQIAVELSQAERE